MNWLALFIISLIVLYMINNLSKRIPKRRHRGIRPRIKFFWIINSKRVIEVYMLILSVTQKVTLSIQPIDVFGNPAAIDGLPVWTSSNPDMVTISVSEDGLSATVESTGLMGSTQISVSVDADLGSGVEELVGVLDIEVKSGKAVGINITAGTPEERQINA